MPEKAPQYTRYQQADGSGLYSVRDVNTSLRIGFDLSEEESALIVRAVNSRQALVEALQLVIHPRRDFDSEGRYVLRLSQAELKQVEAALELAKEKP